MGRYNATESQGMRSPRVLFVDDEAAVLKALSRNFHCLFDISSAYSAEEAKHLLKGVGDFDVVVTDISMPGLNGLDFIESVSAEYPDTRFIVLTGNQEAEVLSRADEMESVFQVLSKPAGTDEVKQAIQAAHAAFIRT